MINNYMNIAINEAKRAYQKGEVPVGAVIIKEGKIIAKAHNQKESKNSVLAHAEIIAIKKASKKLKNWRLNDCEIYITLEPCPMCASAIQQARIKKVYYGCEISESENSKIINRIFSTTNRNQKIDKVENIKNEKCKKIIQTFFQEKRNKTNVR